MRINQSVTEQSVEGARQALRQERSVLMTYLRNYESSSEADRRRHKAVARHVAKMMLSLNKVVFLKKQQEILTSMRELYDAVRLPTASVVQKWQNNLALLQQERARFNRYCDELVAAQQRQ